MNGEEEIKTQLRALTSKVHSLREELRASLRKEPPRQPEHWEVRDRPSGTPPKRS